VNRAGANGRERTILEGINAQVEFIRDASGKVTELVMYQHGRSRKVPRISD
jgi:hypothetical protein